MDGTRSKKNTRIFGMHSSELESSKEKRKRKTSTYINKIILERWRIDNHPSQKDQMPNNTSSIIFDE